METYEFIVYLDEYTGLYGPEYRIFEVTAESEAQALEIAEKYGPTFYPNRRTWVEPWVERDGD